MAAVSLRKVEKTYPNGFKAVHGVDLDVRDGEFMVFVGPSGCAKSTLLRMVAGLESITGGELHIGGRVVNDIAPKGRGIAMVFQNYALYPHMTVYDNLAFGLKLAKTGKAELDQRVRHAAQLLEMEHLLERYPKQLSGGQAHRVAVGRAIVKKPEVFLFDEPLSNLDAALRVRMRYEFAKLHEDLKTTMIYVTHDQVEAMTLADRIVVLSAGKIEQVGSPLELYEHPCNLFVAGFIGSPKMNFIAGELVAVEHGHVDVKLAGSCVTLRARVDGSGASLGDKVTLGVRPEHIRQGGHGNLLQSTVAFVESLGGITFAYCPYPGLEEPLTCQFEGRNGADRLRTGQALDLHLPEEALYVFDSNGRALRRLAAPELSA